MKKATVLKKDIVLHRGCLFGDRNAAIDPHYGGFC